MGQGFEAVLKALGGFASVEVEPEDLQNSSSSARGRQVGGDIGAARATYVAQRGNQSVEAEGLGQTCGGWGQPWSASASPPRAAAAIAPSCRLGRVWSSAWFRASRASKYNSKFQYLSQTDESDVRVHIFANF
eukprot:SAG31_NODE_1277_length_9041_cov_22.545627_7_plen_133_part_00